MNLYELTNGEMGESYLRCYVWASDMKRALGLGQEAFAREGHSIQKIEAVLILHPEMSEFVTTPSDCGWTR